MKTFGFPELPNGSERPKIATMIKMISLNRARVNPGHAAPRLPCFTPARQRPPEDQGDDEGRTPRQARAVAVVRVREHSTHGGIGEDRKRGRGGERPEIGKTF